MSILQQLPKRLVPWHRKNKRDLPWRTDASAYHTWLSEIMLQQTRIEAVIPYYYRFLNELPTVSDLANVPEERLLKLWEGLGYYNRARNLKKAAVQIMEQYGGQLPATFDELRRLPGIGDYTAGAIASMSFGRPEPAVDGNVLRVITRFTGDKSDIALGSTKKDFTEKLRRVYPSGADAGDFTEGLMELGETICIPAGAPKCNECPLNDLCVAHRENMTDLLPVKSDKKQRRIQPKTVFILQHENRFALHKRADKGLLAGMWELPNVDGTLNEEGIKDWLCERGCNGEYQQLDPAVHIFTHIEWRMQGIKACCQTPDTRYIWVTAEQLLNDYALPTAFRDFKSVIMKQQ